MCFSDSSDPYDPYNPRRDSRRAVTAVVREAESSTQGYGQRPQPAQYAVGGYSYSQNFRVGSSYAQSGHPQHRPANDPRAVWGQEYTQRPSQPPSHPRPYTQPYQQHPQNYPQQYAPQYNRHEGQQKFRPYRPDPLEGADVQKVPVSRPGVASGYAQERHQSVHGEIVYDQPSRTGSAAYPGASQRETVLPQRPAGLKPSSRPMNPELTPSKSRPGKLVRRDSNGVSECSDDDYAVDLRDYTVSPDIFRGRPNRPRKPSKY